MSIDANFTFSQSALQDFVDCQRRFELKYVQKLRWPALQTEPALAFEHLTEMGVQFHRLVEQSLLGLPNALITKQIADPLLQRWWDAWAQQHPQLQAAQQFVEVELATQVAGHTLTAKYDLVSITPDGKITIYDWKTSENRPKDATLQQRLQTRIYPFVMTQAGQTLTGAKVDPNQIEMIYWYPNVPEQPAHFRYDATKLSADVAYIEDLIKQVLQRNAGQFGLTTDEKRCKFCQYRSLCDRGIKAGNLAELEADLDDDTFDVDLDSITAIDFD